MAEGHREAAPRVLDGREHDGILAAVGRQLSTRHIAVYPRILTAANSRGTSLTNELNIVLPQRGRTCGRGRVVMSRSSAAKMTARGSVVHQDRKADAEDVLDTVSGTTGIAGAADSVTVLGRGKHGVKLSVRWPRALELREAADHRHGLFVLCRGHEAQQGAGEVGIVEGLRDRQGRPTDRARMRRRASATGSPVLAHQ